MEDLQKVEAVLFTTGKFMGINDIARACGIASEGYVAELVKKLAEEYNRKNTSLIIIEQNGMWKMGINEEYKILASKLISSNEFDSPTTKTLAVIAYKQPSLQAEVVKIRGNKSYEHIAQLKEAGLVTSEKSGRTRVLKVTPKFYEYFDISEEKLKETFEQIAKEKPEDAPLQEYAAQADEVSAGNENIEEKSGE